MSFSISLSGHLSDPAATADDAIEVFDNAVRALRTLGANPSGSISGSEGGTPFTRTATDVLELEAQDTTDDGADDSAPTSSDGPTPATNG